MHGVGEIAVGAPCTLRKRDVERWGTYMMSPRIDGVQPPGGRTGGRTAMAAAVDWASLRRFSREYEHEPCLHGAAVSTVGDV